MRKSFSGQRPPRQGREDQRAPGRGATGPREEREGWGQKGRGRPRPGGGSEDTRGKDDRRVKDDRRDSDERRPNKGGPKPHGKSGRRQPAGPPAITERMRIAKAMARAGLCSRREAERWIADGRVSVNGQVLKTPAVEVGPKDRVLVDGKPLPVSEPTQLWRYHKPKGLVTTHADPQGRPTVFENLPQGLPRVVSVGRLDFNTEGLLLLTNDGELARHLELPATGWLRRYRVRAKGRVTQEELDKLKDGIEIEGVKYGPIEARVESVQGANAWLSVAIREGKNREVRKVLGTFGLEVNRLIRVSFGPFQLLDLEPGQAEHVKRRVLGEQLGPQLAREFGLVDEPDKKPPHKGGGHGKGGKPGEKPAPERRET